MKKEYVAVWEETYSSFIMDIFTRNILLYPYVIGNDLDEYISFKIKGELIRTFCPKEVMNKIMEEHGKYFLDISNFKRIVKKYEKQLEEFEEIIQRIKKKDLSKLNDRQIYLLFKELMNFLLESGAYYRSTRHETEAEASVIVRYILAKNFENVNEQYGIITDSIKNNLIARHKERWNELLSKEFDEEEIWKFIEDFPCFFVNIWDKKKIIQMLREQHRKEKSEEIKKINLKEKQDEIFRICNNKTLNDYAEMLQEIGYYRFETKQIWAGYELRLILLFEEISKRMNITIKDFFSYFLIEDVENFFVKKIKISEEELEKRKKCLAVIIKDGKYGIKTGNDAIELLNIVNPTKDGNQVKGAVACRGIVRGIARIVYPYGTDKSEEEANKFNKGEILVTTNTQPSMVPLMAKTSAMVSDTGGITCHTAIIAREFNIPCIVGTVNGTRVFKDGDFIEVNAEEGTVRKI
ncbi:hypothetical protein KY343_04395 [Candidatus Woesearchaeota archaeon]|nr:hypothetical protein [Candidatus Woesearchaeota archaeon]